ncbi:MAG: putative lipid II flippase FtsW [Gammaproteobacteria bacterium]|nr:putative lipid II flippase FtsW [Gammaproteobacteria bacterium]
MINYAKIFDGFWQRKQPGSRSTSQRSSSQNNKTQSLILDYWFVGSVVCLLCIGVVMTGSASIGISDKVMHQPLYFLTRQIAYVGVGLLLAFCVLQVRLSFWQKSGPFLLIGAITLLILVVVPGIGLQVNGSARWISLGFVNLQPSEFTKLFFIIYLSGYLVRRGEEIRETLKGFLIPIVLLTITSLLLFAEPDFGAVVVLSATVFGMLFLAGVRLLHFTVFVAVVIAALVGMAFSAPYRMQRLTTFLNPWDDPFNSGFQLTQALIAFGRGEWFGVGLGASVQKLFYLPEAHTDFVFAVIAEELGLAGSFIVIGLFSIVVWRILYVASQAEKIGNCFAAYLAYGIGLWLSLQVIINLGVNMGVLPTKGLTLPLMSYGGSSMVMVCISLAIVMRIFYEVHNEGESSGKNAFRSNKRNKRRNYKK